MKPKIRHLYAAFTSLILALFLYSPSPILAQDFFGPKPIGMGGAFRAVADDNNAIEFNPAGLAQKGGYDIEAVYMFGSPGETNLGHASIVDGHTNPSVTAGLSLTYGDFPSIAFGEAETRRTFRGRLALAQKFSRSLYWGVTGKYIQIERGLDRFFLPEDVELGIPTVPTARRSNTAGSIASMEDVLATENDGGRSVTFDLGFLYRPIRYVSLGFVGQNIVSSPLREIRRKLTPAVSFNPVRIFTLAADFEFDLDKDPKRGTLNQHYGGSLLLGESFQIRGGYLLDGTQDQQFWSLGIGATFGNGFVNFGFQQDTDNSDNLIFLISLIVNFRPPDPIKPFKSLNH